MNTFRLSRFSTVVICGGLLAADVLGAGPRQDVVPGDYPSPYTQRHRTEKDVYGGIDFWKEDALNVPDYDECRNMLSNPSFESELRYYTFPCDIGSYLPGYEEKYTIDHMVAKFGGASLKIKVLAPPYPFDTIQSFGYPVDKNAVYTLSFYAKASKPGLTLAVKHISANFYAKEQLPTASRSSFELTSDWQRYTIRIKSNSTGYAFAFAVHQNRPSETVWIDAVQLEAGEKATDYVERPVSAMLTTAAPGNFLTPGQPVNGRLRLYSSRSTDSGRATVTLKDFFYREVKLGNFSFTFDRHGTAEIPLPLEQFIAGKKGIFVVHAQITLADGGSSSDYFRFSVMDKMQGHHLNKTLLAYHQLVIPNYEAAMQRWRDIGLGSTNYFYYNFHDRRLFDILRKYDIEETCAPLRQHWNVTLSDGQVVKRNNAISIQSQGAADQNARILIQGWTDWTGVTPEQEKQFEEAARQFAAYYSWRHNFALDHEMHNRLLDVGNYRDLAKIMIACAKGVKKANPANQAYLEGGAANLPAGISLTDNLLYAAAKVDPNFRFDRFAVHAYGHPENEEFDELLARFLAVLDKHGYDNAPLYVNEGGYYSPYCIAEWGLTPYRPLLMDHYHLWGVSYDMGWGERVSAALTVRSWLLALKYQSRIRQFNNWRPFFYLDCDLSPMAVQKMANTLMRLLGNAKFKREIVFAPQSRAYLFEDADQTPIAAIWGFETEIEQGKVSPLIMKLRQSDLPLQVFDAMENAVSFSPGQKDIRLALSPFPIFIKGPRGKLAELAALVNNIRVDGGKSAPIRVVSQLKDDDTATLTVKNLLTRPFAGNLAIQSGPKQLKQTLTLPSLGQQVIDIKFAQPAMTDKINQNGIDWRIDDNLGETFSQSIALNVFAINQTKVPISLTGNFDEWKNFPWLSLPSRRQRANDAKKFDARFKVAWDEHNFYLLVDVIDDHLFYGAKIRNTAHATDCDALIVYFDTLGNGKEKSTLRVDSDDYYYLFMPRPDEHNALVYTQEACNQQLSIGVGAIQAKTYVQEVKTFFRRTDRGYCYEIAFPQLTVLPMLLKNGTTFGLGMQIWDQDSEKDLARSLNLSYPPRSSCWRSAQLWPQVILKKKIP